MEPNWAPRPPLEAEISSRCVSWPHPRATSEFFGAPGRLQERPGADFGALLGCPLGPHGGQKRPGGGSGPHFGLSGVPPGSILGTILSDVLCDVFKMLLLHRACVSVLVLVFAPVFCSLAFDLGTAEPPLSIHWVTFMFACVLVVAHCFLKASKPQRQKLEALDP